MYNDYYLSSIDNKLNNLSTIITNQEFIINNQASIIEQQSFSISCFQYFFIWIVLLLSWLLFYNFFHRIFNHKR